MAILINIPAFNTTIAFKVMDNTGDCLQLTPVFDADAKAMPRQQYERQGRLIMATHESLADQLANMFMH